MTGTDLYRHYDSRSELLYVGISLSAVARLSQHKLHAHWFTDIRRVEIERFDTPDRARAAERKAIKGEKPKHNIAHRIIVRPKPKKRTHIDAADIIKAFGGVTKAAKAMGVPITTLYSWKTRGSIPDWRYDAIMKAARNRRVKITRIQLEAMK